MDPDRQCSARSKRTGNQCGRTAAPGSSVCHMHGAGTKGTKQRAYAEVKAAKLDAHAEASRMVASAGVDADPIEHLLDSLHRAAALVEVWGRMVADLDNAAEVDLQDRPGGLRGEVWYETVDVSTDDAEPKRRRVPKADRLLALNREGMVTPHPFVDEYHKALDRRAKFAKLAIDAGVEERRVEIEEEKGRQVAAVIKAVLADLGHDLAADDVRKVVGRHLRAVG